MRLSRVAAACGRQIATWRGGIDRLQIAGKRLRRGRAARVVLLQVRQRPAEPIFGEAARAAMAGRAVGREQLRTGLALVEILRL